MATETFANALRRHGGMWGSALDSAGQTLTDVVQVTATVQRARIEIPLVGQQRVGYKPGRTSAEGSIAFQKVDTAWELLVYNSITTDIEEMRKLRDAGTLGTLDGTFNLTLSSDDPYAYGKEVWQATGCQIWQFDLGINTTEEFIQRELPLTFDEAIPIRTYKVVNGKVVVVHSLTSSSAG